ncbi:MAG TPA: STAS domain-containing protein, partial [Spirochaetota bacterium]|nr:STAS domain-containing protein [Spirochaetota bacterium]
VIEVNPANRIINGGKGSEPMTDIVNTPISIKDIKVINVGAVLDFEGAHKFDEELTSAIASGARFIVLNLSMVTQITSAALGVIIAKNSDVRKNGGGIRMSAVPAGVLKIFDLVSFDEIFKIYDNDDDAIASFMSD